MRESIKEYLPALLRWWYLLLAFIIGDVLGIVTIISPIKHVSGWVWITIGIVALLIAQFMAFHTVRVERDKFKSQLVAKPSLWIRGMHFLLLTDPRVKENTMWNTAWAFNVSIANMSPDTPLNIRGIIISLNPNMRLRPFIGKPNSEYKNDNEVPVGNLGGNLYLQPNESKEGVLLFVNEAKRSTWENQPAENKSFETLITLIDNQGKEYSFPTKPQNLTWR